MPLNLLGGKPTISSVDTGFWARRAAAEMSKYAAIDWAASADPKADQSASAEPLDWRTVVPSQFTRMPDASTWRVADDAGFVHLCANETIGGVELLDDPDLPALSPSSSSSPPPPVVADFTSCLLSRHVDVSKYGVLYCSGGKNLGPAGLTLALVRDDLLDGSREHPLCPSVLSYKTLSSSKPIGSIYATPPTYGIYMLSLVLDDLHARGGLRWAAERTARRPRLRRHRRLGRLLHQPVEAASRSRISVPFGVTGGGGPPAGRPSSSAASSPRPPRPASVTSPATPSPAAPASPFTMACPSAPSRHSPTSCTPSAARTSEGGAAGTAGVRERESSRASLRGKVEGARHTSETSEREGSAARAREASAPERA